MKELLACKLLMAMLMTNLLFMAYKNIDVGNVQSAIDALEMLVCVEPMNVEAWEAYMQICETLEELDHLCERVLKISSVTPVDRESIIEYYDFLRQKFNSYSLDDERQQIVTLELVDQFNYTVMDQSLFPGKVDLFSRFKQEFDRLLGMVITIPYLVLLLIGLRLLLTGNSFGYWVLFVLLLGIATRLYSLDVQMVFVRKFFVRQGVYSHKRNDEINYHPELIR